MLQASNAVYVTAATLVGSCLLPTASYRPSPPIRAPSFLHVPQPAPASSTFCSLTSHQRPKTLSPPPKAPHAPRTLVNSTATGPYAVLPSPLVPRPYRLTAFSLQATHAAYTVIPPTRSNGLARSLSLARHAKPNGPYKAQQPPVPNPRRLFSAHHVKTIHRHDRRS